MRSTANWALKVRKYLTPIAWKKIGLLEINTSQVLFWIILKNLQNWIHQRKVQRKRETYWFLDRYCQLSLTQSIQAWNIALLKELSSHRHVLMKIVSVLWVCIHNDGSILKVECGCVACLVSLCKHVFAMLHDIENEVTFGHRKTCTSKKQKWDACVYRKNEKLLPPTETGNVLFAKPHLEYEYGKIRRCLSRSRSDFDAQSPSFCQKDWGELVKATKGTASVLQLISINFSSTHVVTPMSSCPPTVWDIVSNLNLNVKKSSFGQLSKQRGNQLMKDI